MRRSRHLAEKIDIRRDTVLFRPGDPCKGFVLLHEGVIRVTLGAANGREVVLYRVAPGDVCLQTFSCLVEHRDYSAEGIAETDLVAEIIPPDGFLERIATDDGFRQQVFAAVARRFSDFEMLVENVALTRLDARVARIILALSTGNPQIAITHDQLAREAASGRAAISRQLSVFAERGWVRLERGCIVITDFEGLRSLARS